MIEFFSTVFGFLIVYLAIRHGQKDGYPYLGDLEQEEENE
jgi:hypothetical protein